MVWAAQAVLAALIQGADPQAEGVKALEAGRYEEAVQLFLKAVDASPEDYGARFHLALAHSLSGRPAEAIGGYKKVLELKPGLYEAQLNLGILLLRQKDAAGALACLEQALSQKPLEFRPAYFAGEARLAAGQFQKAEEAFGAAAHADPKSADAELGLGRAIARQGRLADAAAHYRKAAELDASLQTGLLELAEAFEAAKQPAEAIAIYQTLPDNPAVRERLGSLLLESGRAAQAIPHLEFAAGKSPTAANRYALATAYLRNNETDKALTMMNAAVTMEPASKNLRLTYGRMLRDARRFPEAASEFAQVVKADPGSREAWGELAGICIVTENYPQALAALDRLRALGAETAAHFYFRGVILDRTQQYAPALENYRRFLALSQNQSPNEEFKARQRIKILEKELQKR